MKLIYKDDAGNKLFIDKDVYFAKNAREELMSKHGLYSMMKERNISTKDLKEIYRGTKRNIPTNRKDLDW